MRTRSTAEQQLKIKETTLMGVTAANGTIPPGGSGGGIVNLPLVGPQPQQVAAPKVWMVSQPRPQPLWAAENPKTHNISVSSWPA